MPVLESIPQSWGTRHVFHCPGCNGGHRFDCRTDGERPSWTFDGNLARPTFSPSLLCRTGYAPLRQFPILGPKSGNLESIPWDMIAPHDDRATRNHDGQTLHRLARRGGLDYSEAIAILEDRPWKSMDRAEAAEVLGRMIVAHYKAQPDHVCHSFVRDGQIQFLADCTHALAGQTVAIPEID